ncbi:MAG: bifunctional folylpolyglutamate synthase/dihydrofolate synthase [Bacteroidales bacterium]|nr:bifunctional folylpolyglutamate synthase/dihydrofolate synthase [Bacteroidales bacterium]
MTEKEYNKLLEEIYQRFPSFQVVGGRAFKPGLGNMMALDEALGHPSRDFRAVHIAGTNGKGSVSHMIASALMSFPGQSGNLRVGLYTSPHLVDFRERIKVDGQMVEKEWVFNFLKDHKDLFEKTDASFFEITTAMAFSYFSYRKVDVAVIECGLGGRLDSTNIISPLASVITNIGFDHMQYLGNSLEEIAAEKAGIIKPGIPAIIGETSGVERVFIDKASDCCTDIYFAEKLNPYNLSPDGAFRSFFHRETDAREEALKSILSLATCLLASVDPGRMDLKGDCQKKNIKTVCTALAVILRKMLDDSQKDLSEGTLADMVEAIENAAHITGLRGRWEKLGDNPLIICDIGHNAHGMKVLMPQVERTYKEHNNGRLIMFFGVMKDKDLAAEVGFLPKDAHYLYINAATPRALPASDLKVKMDEFGFTGEIPVDGSISSGLQWIKENTKPEDFVFIGGSSYVVAEVLANW